MSGCTVTIPGYQATFVVRQSEAGDEPPFIQDEPDAPQVRRCLIESSNRVLRREWEREQRKSWPWWRRAIMGSS